MTARSFVTHAAHEHAEASIRSGSSRPLKQYLRKSFAVREISDLPVVIAFANAKPCGSRVAGQRLPFWSVLCDRKAIAVKDTKQPRGAVSLFDTWIWGRRATEIAGSSVA